MEKDSEVKGNGNSYDFGARIYDPRIGRWLVLDPLSYKYPTLSPFVYVANSPMSFVDKDGESIRPTNSVAESTLNTAFDNVFSSFPEIREHIVPFQIGTNQEGQPVNAFVYAKKTDNNSTPELSYGHARKIIINSSLSTKDKLIALAYLKGLEETDVNEFQQPFDEEQGDVSFGINLGDPKKISESRDLKIRGIPCNTTSNYIFSFFE